MILDLMIDTASVICGRREVAAARPRLRNCVDFCSRGRLKMILASVIKPRSKAAGSCPRLRMKLDVCSLVLAEEQPGRRYWSSVYLLSRSENPRGSKLTLAGVPKGSDFILFSRGGIHNKNQTFNQTCILGAGSSNQPTFKQPTTPPYHPF